MLSGIGQLFFQVRQALVQGESKFNFGGGLFDIKEGFAVCGHLTLTSRAQVPFKQIPVSLLDSFRIINFLEIDYIAVIKGFFIILGFKEDNMNKNIQNLIFFLQNISSSYEF